MKEEGEMSWGREVCRGRYSNIMPSWGGMGTFDIIRGICTFEFPVDVTANDVLVMQSN